LGSLEKNKAENGASSALRSLEKFFIEQSYQRVRRVDGRLARRGSRRYFHFGAIASAWRGSAKREGHRRGTASIGSRSCVGSHTIYFHDSRIATTAYVKTMVHSVSD
jgi:hypothetical protein